MGAVPGELSYLGSLLYWGYVVLGEEGGYGTHGSLSIKDPLPLSQLLSLFLTQLLCILS